eukprot:TRINITY_DN7693_c0_g2_i1.p1 TRINITY_DN7693_c0_g2~~TRINITY_DN7693_c0_g2_i1.p1  ORF type:complete len:112 (+),score=33.73 TRINITY_DN7693_c0_g2_i1:652-987(+)
MEKVSRGSLADFVLSRYRNKRTISEEEGRQVMRQILEGVDYIHSNSVIHRDLKPGNILMTSFESLQRSVRILDFGLSAPLDSELLVERCGTRCYMAPEQLEARMYGKVSKG